MVFKIDPSLNKPLVIYRPYAHEFKKADKPVQKQAPRKKQDSVTKLQNTAPKSERAYGSGEIQSLIIQYAKQYGIAPESPLCIAKLESGFNPNAKNKRSSAGGVFQYLESTFRATDEGLAGHSRFEVEPNIKAAIKHMAIHKSTKPWTVAPNCPRLQFL